MLTSTVSKKSISYFTKCVQWTSQRCYSLIQMPSCQNISVNCWNPNLALLGIRPRFRATTKVLEEDLKQENQVGQRKFSRFYGEHTESRKYLIPMRHEMFSSVNKLWAFMFLFTGCVNVLPPGAGPREDARYTMSLLGNSLYSSPLIILSSERQFAITQIHDYAGLAMY